METVRPADILPFYRWYKANPVPKRGGGLNNWLFVAALRLRHYTSMTEALEVLESLNIEAVKEGEILRQVECAFEADTTGHRAPRWPKPNADLMWDITHDQLVRTDKYLSHPFTKTPATEEAIDALFPGDPLLCVGATDSFFYTQPRRKWRGVLHKKQLIVPSPMSAMKGLTLKKKESYHTLDNTGPRHYLITEFDAGHIEGQIRRIDYLATGSWNPPRLRMLVHSGGKSLHGWWDVKDRTEEENEGFFRRAVEVGADPHTWLRSQFVRMPDGWRKDKGRIQHILYFAL